MGGRAWLSQLSLGVSAIRIAHRASPAASSDAEGEDKRPARPVDQPLLYCPSLLASLTVDAGTGPRSVWKPLAIHVKNPEGYMLQTMGLTLLEKSEESG
jgi:hypothetical protein